MGPSAIRIARLEDKLEELGHDVTDHGNIRASDMSTAPMGDVRARCLSDIIGACELLAEKVSACIEGGAFPLVVGGDQSISIGTAAGLARGGRKRGLTWVDAHADFNTNRTTPSGNIHGMALAAVLGYGHPGLSKLGGVSPKALEANTVLVGGRSFDRGEAKALSRSKVTVFPR